MKRREFITLLGGAAAWPLAAHAQQHATPQRMAMFHPAIPPALLTETGGGSAWRAFFGELRRLGYVEGQNLAIERYWDPRRAASSSAASPTAAISGSLGHADVLCSRSLDRLVVGVEAGRIAPVLPASVSS